MQPPTTWRSRRLSPKKKNARNPQRWVPGRRDACPGGPNMVDPGEKKPKGNNGSYDGDVENPSPLGKVVSCAKITEGG